MLNKKLGCFILIVFIWYQSIGQSADSCKIPDLPFVPFKNEAVALSLKAKRILDTIAILHKYFPNCKIKVSSHSHANEGDYQRSWDKTYFVINYLRKKGIEKDKLIFEYGTEGDPEEIGLYGTMEDGPSWVPEPVPCFSLRLPKYKRCINKDGSFRHY